MIREAVYKLLTADATLAGLVGTRIYPEAIPARTQRPAIVIDTLTLRRIQGTRAATAWRTARFEVGIVADSVVACNTVAQAVLAVLGRYQGTVPGLSGITIDDIVDTDSSSERVPRLGDGGVYALPLEFEAFWKET
ncbi:MAG: DUF3168 domain-containing protein [Deltaproteobacteria bacterium]|nr:DUF3168 domain-containing protein [Deltaproteobacteria bacterium]